MSGGAAMTATMPDVLDEAELMVDPTCQLPAGCDRSASLAVRGYCACLLLLCQPCYLAQLIRLGEYELALCGHGAAVRCNICRSGATFWPPDVASQVFVSVVPL